MFMILTDRAEITVVFHSGIGSLGAAISFITLNTI